MSKLLILVICLVALESCFCKDGITNINESRMLQKRNVLEQTSDDLQEELFSNENLKDHELLDFLLGLSCSELKKLIKDYSKELSEASFENDSSFIGLPKTLKTKRVALTRIRFKRPTNVKPRY